MLCAVVSLLQILEGDYAFGLYMTTPSPLGLLPEFVSQPVFLQRDCVCL